MQIIVRRIAVKCCVMAPTPRSNFVVSTKVMPPVRLLVVGIHHHRTKVWLGFQLTLETSSHMHIIRNSRDGSRQCVFLRRTARRLRRNSLSPSCGSTRLTPRTSVRGTHRHVQGMRVVVTTILVPPDVLEVGVNAIGLGRLTHTPMTVTIGTTALAADAAPKTALDPVAILDPAPQGRVVVKMVSVSRMVHLGPAVHLSSNVMRNDTVGQ